MRPTNPPHSAIRPDGEVVLTPAAIPELEDAALDAFLMVLARDIASHPERLHAMDVALRERLQSLVGEVEIDLDAALSADDE
jgi:antitoxin PrlF